MKRNLTSLLIGLVLGVGGTLLLTHRSPAARASVAEQLEAELRCDDGPIDQTAVVTRRASGYSNWAVLHAKRMVGIGCDAGPATIYIRFDPWRDDLERALASMRGYGTLCIVNHGFFHGGSLNPGQLDDLCRTVGGRVRAF